MRRLLMAAWLGGLLACGCQQEHRIAGRVSDFDTGQPLAGVELTARQSGWGLSDGSLVWDKAFPYTAVTDAQGRFELRYRHGASAQLWLTAPAYQRLVFWSGPAADLRIPLKRLHPDYAPPTTGFLAFGQTRDGRFYGWDFSRCATVDDPQQADLIPVSVAPGRRAPVALAAGGEGGIQCRSYAELGVPGQPLSYSDTAPESGYRRHVVLNFEPEQGGVCFVRTRDGRHYAKFAYTPESFGARSHPSIARDVMFRFVYNPAGSPDLSYQEEGPNPSCGDPWTSL